MIVIHMILLNRRKIRYEGIKKKKHLNEVKNNVVTAKKERFKEY